MAETIERPKTADAVDRHIAERIKTLRVHYGVTQEEIAEALGITFQQVQKYERGFNRVSAGRLYLIARALKVPVQSLFPSQHLEEFAPAPPKRLRMMRIVAGLAEKHHDDMLRILHALDHMVMGAPKGD